MDFLASAYPGVPYLAPVTWDDLAWLRSVTRLPVTVKGIMTAEDALEAVACGIDGIVVSNHGGRQLDDVPGSIEVLGEIVDAVEGRAAVLLDGGVQTGGDAAIALCLGADAVTIGRPVLWALAAGGPEGVRSFLGAFVQDLARTMVLLGATSLDELRPAMVMSDGLSRRHGGGDGPSAPSV
jgi:4-hydroxymandelate oxidase